ncbi:MAG: 50S ribosomal protein L4 [Vampirovibrionales bacterium]
MTLTTLKKFNAQGQEVGTVDVPEALQSEVVNEHLLYLQLKVEVNNAKRFRTACSKTRSEVRGGGRKPWKQKGTGRARAGSIRSPLWRGGGVTFGPKPRVVELALPRKMSFLARRDALVSALPHLKVLENVEFAASGKTKEVVKVLQALSASDKKVLWVLAQGECVLKQATRNLPRVTLGTAQVVSVKDALRHDLVIASEAAFNQLVQQFQG